MDRAAADAARPDHLVLVGVRLENLERFDANASESGICALRCAREKLCSCAYVCAHTRVNWEIPDEYPAKHHLRANFALVGCESEPASRLAKVWRYAVAQEVACPKHSLGQSMALVGGCAEEPYGLDEVPRHDLARVEVPPALERFFGAASGIRALVRRHAGLGLRGRGLGGRLGDLGGGCGLECRIGTGRRLGHVHWPLGGSYGFGRGPLDSLLVGGVGGMYAVKRADVRHDGGTVSEVSKVGKFRQLPVKAELDLVHRLHASVDGASHHDFPRVADLGALEHVWGETRVVDVHICARLVLPSPP
mmetsp:Transcript_40600/g.100331  ORF Transcript_40600/g.100331 Transcript_40600/m.100331 type:complete len:306 (-) Transcript_40600:352-1269(-)